MATYAIGDIQGCYDELQQLLEKIRFDPARDTLWFCGDLVNRGGQSLAVLRLVHSFGERAITVLGNHDLSLLAVAERDEADQGKVNQELREVLFAPDRDLLLDWLRARPLLHIDRDLNFMLVHAGLAPRWTIEGAERAAREVEQRLRSEHSRRLLKAMFGNKPDLWSPRLQGIERLRASINVLTRMRYCDARGRIAYNEKGAPGTQKPGLYPWFEVPGQKAARHPHRLRALVDARPLPGHGRLRDRRRLRLGRRADCTAPGPRRAGIHRDQVEAADAWWEVR